MIERFQDDALSRFDLRGGNWDVSHEVEIYDLVERDIYQSPEEPGHTAWVGMWKEKDGAIKVSFSRVTGNVGLEPSYRPTYGRSEGEYWKAFCREHKMRPGPEDAVTTTKLVSPTLVTRDNGETWKDLGLQHEPRGGNLRFVCAADGSLVRNGLATLLCRDGRIVCTPHVREWPKKGTTTLAVEKYIMGIRESTDNGKTWTPLQWIAPEGTDPEFLKASGEESAIAELADGRILAVIRCDPGPPIQTLLTRVGPGKYKATPPTQCAMPHGGLPDLVGGSDGVIWYWGLASHWYTADDGASWHKAPLQLRSYYGKMLEAAPNQLLCVTQRLISDSPYPFWYDSSIRMYRFRWRRSGILEQKNDGVRFARAIQKEKTFADLHLRADVRLDGVNGIIFHVSPDGKSYYFLGVVLRNHPLYKDYFPPEVQDEKLAANYAGAEQFQFALGRSMVVLARVEGPKVTLLRGLRILQMSPSYHVTPGTWARVQVKVAGDVIQGAVKIDHPHFPHAVYVAARDAGLESGTTGVYSDRSTGAFRNLEVWDEPQMIRHLWK